MKSIIEQMTGPEDSLEDELYYFYASMLFGDEPRYAELIKSFKGRFDDEHFIPENRRDDYTVSKFTFCPTYLRMDDAFGDEFRGSVDELVRVLKQENESVIVIGTYHTQKQIEQKMRAIPGQVLSNDEADDGTFYMGPSQEKIEKLRKLGAQKARVEMEFKKNCINDIICIVYANEKPFIAYTITPTEELKKEVRLFPGFEQRLYQISGTDEQLDNLEKAFAYLQMLGEQGHSTYINLVNTGKSGPIKFRRIESLKAERGSREYKVVAHTELLDYFEKAMVKVESLSMRGKARSVDFSLDGDGSDRPLFERADRKSLSMPLEHLVLTQGVGRDKKILTPEEFMMLIREHKSNLWKEGENRVGIFYHFKEDDAGEPFLI